MFVLCLTALNLNKSLGLRFYHFKLSTNIFSYLTPRVFSIDEIYYNYANDSF